MIDLRWALNGERVPLLHCGAIDVLSLMLRLCASVSADVFDSEILFAYVEGDP